MTNKDFLLEYGHNILIDGTKKTIEPYFFEYELEEIPLKKRMAIVKTIREWLSADVVEAKHGKWAKSGQSFLHPEKFVSYCCSKCGYEDTEKIKYNFCPNCGADMRGETE